VPHRVVLGQDFPSNFYAWERRALEAAPSCGVARSQDGSRSEGTGTVQIVEHAHDAVRFAERQRLEQLCVRGYLPIALQPSVRLVAAI
jgi:hypothetical protein